MAAPRKPAINYLRVPQMVGFDPLTGAIGPLGLTIALLERAARSGGLPNSSRRHMQTAKRVIQGYAGGARDIGVDAYRDGRAYAQSRTPAEAARDAKHMGGQIVRGLAQEAVEFEQDSRRYGRGGAVVKRAAEELASTAMDAKRAWDAGVRASEEGGRENWKAAAGTMIIAGSALTPGRGARLLSKAPGVEDYLAKGYRPEVAKTFAEPYPDRGMGSHFIPRDWEFPDAVLGVPLPKPIAGQRLPRAISDSPFNVQKPRGLTKGELYELHYLVDPRFHGGPVPTSFGGGGWSGKELGWRRAGPVGRIWHGSPTALKRAVGVSAGSGLLAYDFLDGEEEEP